MTSSIFIHVLAHFFSVLTVINCITDIFVGVCGVYVCVRSNKIIPEPW